MLICWWMLVSNIFSGSLYSNKLELKSKLFVYLPKQVLILKITVMALNEEKGKEIV
jgi:hypothetical protein